MLQVTKSTKKVGETRPRQENFQSRQQTTFKTLQQVFEKFPPKTIDDRGSPMED